MTIFVAVNICSETGSTASSRCATSSGEILVFPGIFPLFTRAELSDVPGNVRGVGNLASAVDELLAVDVREAPGAQLQEETAEILRQINRLNAALLTRVEAVDRRGLAPEECGATASWLWHDLRLSPNAAHRMVRLSRTLADVLPGTIAAMADGDVSLEHAQLIASLRRVITDSALSQVEQHLVAIARERRPDQLRGTVHYVKHAYAPDKGVKDEQELHDQRSLSMDTTLDGAGVGRWLLPGASQETLATAIHAASAPEAGDTRSADQRRADALVTIAEIALRSGQLSITGGVKPHVTVIVPAQVAAQPLQPRPLPDAMFPDLDSIDSELRQRVAETGFGSVISPNWARRFLCDAAVSRIVMTATSEILDAGRATRTWAAAQIRAITARDRGCIWPGCTIPAAWCEAHHINHWADGGDTSVTNGALICGRHHDRVHLHGHAITRRANGQYTIDLRKGSDPNWQGPRNRAGP